jgi:hypothetical protein
MTRDRWLRHPRGWAPDSNDLERLFWPPQLRSIVSCLSLDELGGGSIAERPVVRVRARPRPEAILWPQWLPVGADEYLLAFDVEWGSLLFFEGRRRGQVLGSVEVTSVTFGEPIDDGIFVPEVPGGWQRRPWA